MELRVVQLGALAAEGFRPEARAALTREMASLPDDRPYCIVGVFEEQREEHVLHRAALNAVREACLLRHPCMLVLYGLPVSGTVMENLADDVRAEQALRAERRAVLGAVSNPEMADAVLLLGRRLLPQPEWCWAGVDESTAWLLEQLIQADELRLSDVAAMLQGAEFERLMRFIQGDTQLFDVHEGNVRLRVNLLGVAQLVGRHIEAGFARALTAGGSGLLVKGPYLTPSLSRVSCWLTDTTKLVDSLCASNRQLPMTALATQLVLGGFISHALERKLVLVAEATAPVPLVEGLARALDALAVYLPGEMGVPLGQWSTALSQGDPVVLFTEFMRTGAGVGRCLKEILRLGGVPLAVAALFDGREADEAITVWGHRVRVCALSRVSVSTSDPDVAAKPIDPIWRNEEDPVEGEPNGASDPSWHTFCSVVRRTGGMHLAHITRPADRHFVYYLDLSGILLDEGYQAGVFAAVEAWAGSQSRRSAGDDPQRALWAEVAEDGFELWYPMTAEPDDRGADLARLIASRFRVAETRAVPRVSVGGHWRFNWPTGQAHGRLRARRVLIVDWSAISGNTLLQMAYGAAAAGAERVMVLVALSEMDRGVEDLLTAVRALEAPQRGRRTEIVIRALTAVPIRAYSPSDCPMCRLLAGVREVETPSQWLGDYRLDVRTQLAAQRRERLGGTAAATHPMTLEPIEQDLLVRMMEVAGRLRAASRTTSGRMGVAQWLHTILAGVKAEDAGSLSEAQALILLLWAETQWLRTPPLALDALRRDLAGLAVTMLKRRLTLTERYCANALLRSASKQDFANNLSLVLEGSRESVLLLRQVLFDALTLISRRYNVTHESVRTVGDHLERLLREEFDKSTEDPPQVRHTLLVLQHRAEVSLARADTRSLSTIEAWKLLKRRMAEVFPHHAELRERYLRLTISAWTERLEDARRAATEELPETVERAVRGAKATWEQLCRFVDTRLLPCLSPLERLLRGRDARDTLSEEVVTRLLDLARSPVPMAEAPFAVSTLPRLESSPSAILEPDLEREYKEEVGWWSGVLVGDESTSRVQRLLDSVPANLREIGTQVVRRWASMRPDWELECSIDECAVFGTKELVTDALEHFLANVKKHHVEGSAVTISVGSELDPDGYALLRVRNSGTQSRHSHEHGQGLLLLSERARAFGGDVKAEPRGKDGFDVYIRLQLYEVQHGD